MLELVPTLLAAGLLGLLGAGHCLAMCGGIVAALSFAVPEYARAARWRLNLGYNLGRILGYSLIGALGAGLVAILPDTGWPLARTVAGFLLIAMGLYAAGWWRGLVWLERGGRWIWRWLKPLGDRLLPLDTMDKALMVGFIWGWLPCGLVYAALGYATAQAAPVPGALVMLVFGLGTMPALLVGGVLALRLKTFLAKPRMRVLLALGYIGFGLWTLGGAWYHQFAHAAQSDSAETGHQHHHH